MVNEWFFRIDEIRATKKALDCMYVADVRVNAENDAAEYFNIRKIDDVVDTSEFRACFGE